MKFMEEVFEFRDEWLLYVHEYNKCAYGEAEDDPDVVEHNMAYEKIKGRKGKTINGTFVKEEDLQ